MRDSSLHLYDAQPEPATAMAAADDMAQTEKELTAPHDDDIVELDVSGARMSVLRSTLCAGPPTSVLRRMFDRASPAGWTPPTRDGVYFIDHEPRYFRIVLDALRYGSGAVRFVEGYDLACVRGMADYLGLYDLAAECAGALLRNEDRADPDAHISVPYVFEDSLGDNDCTMGTGAMGAYVRVPFNWPAARALDTIADTLGMHRRDLAFYAARIISQPSMHCVAIGAMVDPAPTTRTFQCPWAQYDGHALFVARRPASAHVALCKVCETTRDSLRLRLPRPLVFGLPDPDAPARDVVQAACARAGIALSDVVAAYVEPHGLGGTRRLSYPPIAGGGGAPGDIDHEPTRKRFHSGDLVRLIVAGPGAPTDDDAPRRLTAKSTKRWTMTPWYD
ncbi:BTB/POZ domain containing protein [Pandoravirus salinus]|uniref:BTB/POZ domain containing protein n=1 Tax=Pandoravirus salinus TaxID=1349410 RepID=S4VZ35_9VIRU|nr:BTB/POZ domain-containing protein [Pandoravirus salinus]AGO85618.1 BTB/POZ domain containing protein [Pandoravirus salinus]